MIHRRAGRVLVRDPAGAVLLCHAGDGHDAGWWFTPGGGTDDGETARDAAERELAEETGIEVELDQPAALHRRARFTFLGRPTEQVESFWHVVLDHRPTIAAVHLEDYEAEALDDWRWCLPADLRHLSDPLYPGCLADLLAAIDDDGVPAVPWVEEHVDPRPDASPTCRRPTRIRDLPSWTRPTWTT